MAKTDWKKLEQKFQRAHARTGIKLQDWCKQNSISYDTARRYIKLRKTAQKNAQKKEQKTAQNSDAFSEEKTSGDKDYGDDDVADDSDENCTNSAETKRNNRSGNPHPVCRFVERNTAAVKHRGYARYLEKDYLFDDAAEMALIDELVFTRARALSVILSLLMVQTSWLQRHSVPVRFSAFISPSMARFARSIRLRPKRYERGHLTLLLMSALCSLNPQQKALAATFTT